MGTVISLVCPCGYVEEEIALGCGFSGTDKGLELVFCDACEETFLIVAGQGPQLCERCKTEVRIIDSYSLRSSEGQGSVGVATCPRCEKKQARYVLIGLWD